ncbi:MAG TPA: NAD+ synthase [Treponema sp.]|nr:NAD+ synthase [Treponema sp.]HRU27940.1 NAD+ synthase [Treponema sp.]
MRIAIAQIDSVIGDFDGNIKKVLSFTLQAKERGADLVLFPELALCGYPPMDLLDQDSFTEGSIRALRLLQRQIPEGIAVGAGYVSRNRSGKGKLLSNNYGIIQNGQVLFEQEKTLLPTYDVFDEARYFESAEKRRIFEFQGKRLGIAICEDMWKESTTATHYSVDPVRELLDRGANVLIVPSASPYYAHKLEQRLLLAEKISHRGAVPIVYINAVGANDSIIFDGRSFVLEPGDKTPQLTLMAEGFKEDLVIWDTEGVHQSDKPVKLGPVDAAEELDTIEKALVLGIRGYMQKCGFKRAHVGLSGGIDSALVAYLAVQAIGPEQVLCFGLPSRFSSQGSKDDARELARNLGCRYELLPIEPAFEAYLSTLEPVFAGRPFDLAEENLQARIRGTLLMAYSNKFDSMLLTTGNKSELAMGYCTLYGDMAGALAPIGDLFKMEVFALCRRINQRELEAGRRAIIPEAILTKPPSAELRPNQTDQDSLPPYEELDQVLNLYLLGNLSKNEIVQQGWSEELVSRIIKTVARAEYKRRQAPPVLKVSQRAFGMGRRMPIARSIYEG